MFSGFVDSQLCQLLTSGIDFAQEYDNSIKQKIAEQFENLARIPFISSGKLFRQFFELDALAMSQ